MAMTNQVSIKKTSVCLNVKEIQQNKLHFGHCFFMCRREEERPWTGKCGQLHMTFFAKGTWYLVIMPHSIEVISIFIG